METNHVRKDGIDGKWLAKRKRIITMTREQKSQVIRNIKKHASMAYKSLPLPQS
jgi:hypothetical protein